MKEVQLSLFENFHLTVLEALDKVFPDDESFDLEYKSAQGGFPQSFWESYSAFANTEGGIIILGIKEHKNKVEIEGLDEEKIALYKNTFWNDINNSKKVNRNILKNDDVDTIIINNKLLLAFRIPVAARQQRPVFLKDNPFNNTFKRNHSGDYKCTNEEVRRMLADADLSHLPDSRILQGFSMDDFDAPSIRQYRQLFASIKPGHAWLTLEDKELLTQLGGYRKDRKTKQEGPTLAGMLMFGKNLSITDPECCPKFFPDFRETLSTDLEIRWTDRIYPDGTWEANLFQFYLKVWSKLSSGLPQPFQIKKGIRQDETPAHVALREAFINALVHTDYSPDLGNIIIEQKKDSYRFSNPGTLLVSKEQYYHGGISECRNTSIQKMFQMIGGAEKAGSGVSKIMSGWNFGHWGNPYLSVDSQPDRVILELPLFSIIPDETLSTLHNLFGVEVDVLGTDEVNILATCQIEGEVTNSRLQYITKKHKTDITKILQKLCKEGYLLSESKNRWTTYILNANYKLATSAPNLATSERNLATSERNLATSEGNLATSEGNLATSEGNHETSKGESKRMLREELNKLIINICKSEYVSIEQIASISNKNQKYIKNEVLPALITQGKIKRLHPNIPNHPKQAYIAADEN